MVRSIEINGLRGIREGKLEDLTKLVVLVGPNGCGKSTILEGLFLCCSQLPARTLHRIARSRGGVEEPARWLLWKSEPGLAQIRVITNEDGAGRTAFLRLTRDFEALLNIGPS